ncbi:MAG: AAA family ATPase [Actinobacteria bacterium]|nr:AAA family ATPase [Actinomycetota bacterium]
MRLCRIAIANHSRIADFDIEVRNHLVLVRANEVGKSSILRCLDLLLGASTAQLYGTLTSSDLLDPTFPLTIEVDLHDFSDSDRALFPDEIMIAPDSQSELLTIRLTAELDDTDAISIQRNAPKGGTNRQLSRDQLLGLGWKFLSAASQTRELREDRKSALDHILQAVDLGLEKETFQKVADSLALTISNSTILNNLRSNLADQLSKALPDPLSKGDLTLIPGATAEGDVLSDVHLQVSKGGIARNISEQSDGMQALFSITFHDLLSGEANVFGIDEPEVHLHPTSQRSLARLLKDRPNQKIIATHSSDIVSAFDPDYVVVIKRGGVVIQPSAGFLSSEEKLVVNWWVRGRLEPLTSRRVVAVEGPSDRIIVERVAELTGRNLDRLGVSLVDAGGKTALPSVEKLFGSSGFDIPLSLLIDEDAEIETANRKGLSSTDLQSHSIWVSRTDLEEEYVRAVGAADVWAALSASTMFSSNQLSSCTPTGAGGNYTIDDVATFCRSHKVEAAIIVAEALTKTSASSIASVDGLVTEVAKM